MPNFAIRWSDLTLSLVEAKNEKDLYTKLDQITDPTTATFGIESSFISLKSPYNPIMEKDRKKDQKTFFVSSKDGETDGR